MSRQNYPYIYAPAPDFRGCLERIRATGDYRALHEIHWCREGFACPTAEGGRGGLLHRYAVSTVGLGGGAS
ncbi:hypothetical protein LQK93_03482 [Terrabacter sp. BE26]